MSFMADNFGSRAIKDKRIRFKVSPARLVWAFEGDGEILHKENLLLDDMQICRVVPSKKSSPSIILDYGAEFNGGIEIHLANEDPKPNLKARIRFGESVSEVLNTPDNDHAIHDTIVEMSIMGKHEFGNTGFRFVRIDFIDCSEPVNVAAVNLIALERDIDYLGSFESSDELLNKVWEVGARTVQLCCQDYILDGIKRDRLLWVGDLHPQINVIANAFGNIDIVAQTLERARILTPSDKWMNGHSFYSIWWIVCVWDWYFYTGDMGWLEKQLPYLEDLVNKILTCIDANGREHLTGKRFMDWGIGFDDEEALSPGLHALTMLGLQKAACVFGVSGRSDYLKKVHPVLNLMKDVDAGRSTLKQVSSVCALAGLISPKQANEESLSVDPCRNISTWFAYYVLQVRAMAADLAGSLDMIRQYWGGMLSLGATTFWEHFDADWLENASPIDQLPQQGMVDVHKDYGEHCFQGHRHSFCHGWAGGPTAWLSQHVLGIRPTSPGFKAAIIDPQLGDLEYVKGQVPTPMGNIKVEAVKSKSGQLDVNYSLPEGVELCG